MPANTHIVVVGAGYGGLLCALGLKKQFKNQAAVTLIDRHNYQLFTYDLYEAATADEEFVPSEKLKAGITLPLGPLLKGKKVEFLRAEIKEIDIHGKSILAGGKRVNFDYLILAAGSTSDDFGITGAELALPLKTYPDALRLRNQIEFAFQAHSLDYTKKNLRFVVAGGGYTGCELAAELVELKNLLCWKYNYPLEKVEIAVVEAASSLIPGFSKRLSRDTYARLKALGAEVRLSSPISRVTSQYVELNSGERLTYDAAVWTAGVKANKLNIHPSPEADRRNRLSVNEFLQVKGLSNVFALGDVAAVLDKSGRPAPCSAQDAIAQAEYLIKALPQIMQNRRPAPYTPESHGFIVALGGRWAIMDYNGIYLKGFLAYFIRELAHINYLRKIMGWLKAVNRVWFQFEIFGRND